MTVRMVLAAGLVLLLALVGVTLAQPGTRTSGSNYVPEVQEIVTIRGDRHCQGGETIPGDTAGLRLLVGTYGRPVPELVVRVTRPGGGRLTAGRIPAGQAEGSVEIPLGRVDDTTPGTRVCVAASGPARTVLYGSGQRVRLEWLRPGEESWFALLPTVAHRFSLGRASFLGSLLLPFAVLLLLAAWAGAVRLVLRELAS